MKHPVLLNINPHLPVQVSLKVLLGPELSTKPITSRRTHKWNPGSRLTDGTTPLLGPLQGRRVRVHNSTAHRSCHKILEEMDVLRVPEDGLRTGSWRITEKRVPGAQDLLKPVVKFGRSQ